MSECVALDPIVRVLRRVVQHLRKELVNDAQQRCSQIGGDISRTFAARQHHLEELSGRRDVASFRDVDVDDLAVLVDRSVHVPPDTGDADVGLIDEPAFTDAVATRPRSLDDQRREPLHPTGRW